MPSSAASRSVNSLFSVENVHGMESRRTSGRHATSRFAREKPLSPHASHGSKFKDKVAKFESSIRPPHSDLPFELVKNANNVFFVQTKSSCSQQQSSKEEELVKYMSKVPGFLQKGEKTQDKNALNFGVLDWGRLENWNHKRDKNPVDEGTSRPPTERPEASSAMARTEASSAMARTEALARSGERPSISNSNPVHTVDFSPVVRPLIEQTLKLADLKSSSDGLLDEKQKTHEEGTSRLRHGVHLKSSKSKKKNSGHISSVPTGKSLSLLSNCDHENRGDSTSDEALSCSEGIEKLQFDTPHQHCSGKQDSIVLLLPKDFSGFGSSEMHHRARASTDGKSAEHNWGSFSDIFSVDEIHSDESYSNIPHSCVLNQSIEIEKELDAKLENLIKAQGVENPVSASDLSLHSPENNLETATITSTYSKACSDLDQSVQRSSAEMSGDLSRHRRFSFALPKMTRSLSFREGSVQPPPCSTYVTAKSGPAKPECSTNSESQNSNKANSNVRAKASPLRRLLDPLLKSKVANQLSDQSNNLRMKPPIAPLHVPENVKNKSSIIKALLHLTVKSGLPLFKFVVEEYNEIFASTVKSLGTLGKVDISWLYTFYSVQRISKKSGGWKTQKVKPSGFGYNIVGQMKVSEPHMPSWYKQEPEDRHMVKESVLYSVDVSKADAATSEFKSSRELASVVVNLDDSFTDFENEKLGRIVAILPGGDHSVPRDGVPSSLINRWRSGGACDCGGWDIGCELRILTDRRQHHKFLQFECDLYDQIKGEAKQCKPFFSLIPLRDGLFSVEFDAQISSLQAFSISVAIINSWKPAHSTGSSDQVESKQEEFCSMSIKSEGPEKLTAHPPLSPVGRV